MKKALISMHSIYKTSATLLSFAWIAGLFGFSLRISIEIEKPERKAETLERALVKV